MANKVKDQILRTASELFYKQGYNNTGINQIIKEANVAKASLYTHFPSKEALATAYLRKRRENWLNKLKEYVGESGSLHDKIKRMFDFIGKKNVDDRFRGCAFINIMSEVTSNDKDIINEVKAQKQSLLNYIQSLFESVDEVTEKELEIKSKSIFLLFEGAIVESRIQKDIWPIKVAQEAALNMV